MWGRSYTKQDVLEHRQVSEEKPASRLRRFYIRSALGGVEVMVARDRLVWAEGQRPPMGWRYQSQEWDQDPNFSTMNQGWRRRLVGFEVVNRFGRPPAPLEVLVTIRSLKVRTYDGWSDTRTSVRWIESLRGVIVPYWALLVVSSVLPARQYRKWSRRRRRRERGLCVKCGYDLRGGGEKCSECGASVGAGVPG
jgi:hypothetical protein